MNEIFQCGDQGALVGYLYDECSPEERDAIALHLTRCVSCAAEIGGLTSTRRALAAWTPPQIDLGIHIMRKADVDGARLAGNVISFARPQPAAVEGASWWKAPLPAWAQVAAAAAIFAAGLSVGIMRDRARAADAPQAVASVPVAGPTKDDLAQLEQRLRTEMAQLAHASTPAPTPVATRAASDVTMEQVKALIEESERRQNIDFTQRAVRQSAAFEAQRRADLESVSSRIGTLQGQTGAQLGQLQQGFNFLATRVSQQK
jgi:putative zinc finger protein